MRLLWLSPRLTAALVFRLENDADQVGRAGNFTSQAQCRQTNPGN